MSSTLDSGQHAITQGQGKPLARVRADIFRAKYSFLYMGIQEGTDQFYGNLEGT